MGINTIIYYIRYNLKYFYFLNYMINIYTNISAIMAIQNPEHICEHRLNLETSRGFFLPSNDHQENFIHLTFIFKTPNMSCYTLLLHSFSVFFFYAQMNTIYYSLRMEKNISWGHTGETQISMTSLCLLGALFCSLTVPGSDNLGHICRQWDCLYSFFMGPFGAVSYKPNCSVSAGKKFCAIQQVERCSAV